MNLQESLACSQIISFNPILRESAAVQAQYFFYLRRLLSLIRLDRRKYTKAGLSFYQSILCRPDNESLQSKEFLFPKKYCFLLPYDIALLTSFRHDYMRKKGFVNLPSRIATDFRLSARDASFLQLSFAAAYGNVSAWAKILRSKQNREFAPYLNLVRNNWEFVRTTPYKILITATMSAGKSTLINALTGKNISRMKNMACTSKIHTIISKPFEDGAVSEDDHNLAICASQEALLTNDVENKTSKIWVSTFFNGGLGGKRLVLFDSPGVNSSENPEHAQITQRMIRSRKYRLLVYVLNATQLGTTDEEWHLAQVRQSLGSAKILFVLNKSDELLYEKEDDILDSLACQRHFLISKGFQNPIICPVSSRAAYLVKKGQTSQLSRAEARELDLFRSEFERFPLSDYYEQELGCPPLPPEQQGDPLLVQCGFAHFEKTIEKLMQEEYSNGSSVRKI